MRTTPFSSPIIRNESVTLNAPNSFTKELVPGQGWYQGRVRLLNSLTIGTGAGPVSEGELRFLRQLYLRTNRGEVVLDSVSARAMYKLAALLFGAPPRKDAIAAANGSYFINIPFCFADPRLLRPEDLILDTNRYESLKFEMTTGPLTDLFTAPGTATTSLFADLELERSRERWNSEQSPPMGFVQYQQRGPVDVTNDTEVQLEAAPDLSIMRILVGTHTSGVSGQPFQGANSDAVIDRLKLTNGDEEVVPERVWEMVQEENKNDFGMESILTGYALFDFVSDGSIKSALYTGDKPNLRLRWVNKSGVAAGYHVSVLVQGYRRLKQGV